MHGVVKGGEEMHTKEAELELQRKHLELREQVHVRTSFFLPSLLPAGHLPVGPSVRGRLPSWPYSSRLPSWPYSSRVRPPARPCVRACVRCARARRWHCVQELKLKEREQELRIREQRLMMQARSITIGY